MKNKFTLSIIVLCALAGCRDPGAASEGESVNSEVGSPQKGQVATEAAPDRTSLVAPQGLERPLPGGVPSPSFPFHVSVDRDTGAFREGHAVREVGIEFLGPTPLEAEEEFSGLIVEQGGSISQREEHGSALKVTYVLSGGTKMLAWFRPGAPNDDRFTLQRPDASGTLYLAWPYVPKSAD